MVLIHPFFGILPQFPQKCGFFKTFVILLKIQREEAGYAELGNRLRLRDDKGGVI